MKKLGIALLLMLLVTWVVALPAAAKKKELAGDQLNLFSPPPTLARNTPFHIRHGFTSTPTTEGVGKFSFALDYDGTRLTEDFVLKTAVLPDAVQRSWVFNFPAGLSIGTHVFIGHFFAPCSATPGPCDNPNEVIETLTLTRTIIVP